MQTAIPLGATTPFFDGATTDGQTPTLDGLLRLWRRAYQWARDRWADLSRRQRRRVLGTLLLIAGGIVALLFPEAMAARLALVVLKQLGRLFMVL